MYDNLLIWIYWILLIFALSIWLDRNIRIIIWCYILMILALAFGNALDLLEFNILVWKITFIPNADKLLDILDSWKSYIILWLYLLIFVFIFRKFNVKIFDIKNKFLRWFLNVLFAPLSSLSLILSLEFVIFWAKMTSFESVQSLSAEFGNTFIIQNFLLFTPIWIILPALFMFLMWSIFRTREKKIILNPKDILMQDNEIAPELDMKQKK